MDIRWVVPFLGGAACGIGLTAITLDKKYEKQMNERIETIKKNYEDFEKELELNKDLRLTEEREKYKRSTEESNTGRENGILPKNERVTLKENWAIVDKDTIDYTKFYTQKETGADVKEPETTVDSVSEEDQKEITEYSEEIRRSSMPPRILSKREMEMIPKDDYEHIRLLYYMYDDTLVIDNDELDAPWIVVHDVDGMVGDCLTKHGFDSDTEEYLYVINYQRKGVYTVKKKWASYTA